MLDRLGPEAIAATSCVCSRQRRRGKNKQLGNVREGGLPLFDAAPASKPTALDVPAEAACELAPLTVTVASALRLTGLGRTKLYELIASRDLEVVKVGRRTLVRLASIERLLAGT